MFKCPCCSKLDYESCCGQYHVECKIPPTPEALMRSRYSAYALANIEYIKKTMQGKPREKFSEAEAKTWASQVKWLKLTILNTQNISPEQGQVEFIARFIENGQHLEIHEISEFQLVEGRWFYVGGVLR